METKLSKKYGLPTAIAMVVGIVIGSGVFFKAETILSATGGNLRLGIVAWLIGGAVMLVCSYAFSVMATKYEKVNGVVDYAEAALGKKYAYYVGWFMTVIYYPTLTMALAWLSARYTLIVIYGERADITGGLCMVLAAFFLVASYALNALSPVLAGRIQVSSTLIKLVPLLLMAVAGTIYGLTKGYTVENFTTIVEDVAPGPAVFRAVCAAAFAYEGWIIATSINAELKNSGKNLPIALVLGSFIVVFVYIFYFIGLAGGTTNAEMMSDGQAGAKNAFAAVFGRFAGTGLFVFVIISCLGTLNGLTLGCTRGMYSVASRGLGPAPEVFGAVDKNTNMPANSSIFGVLLCGAWLLFFYCSQLSSIGGHMSVFAFDPTELPIITTYAFYIPIFISVMLKGKDFHGFQRFGAPLLAAVGSVFMIVAAIYAHRRFIIGYIFVFAAVMAVGALFYKEKKSAA